MKNICDNCGAELKTGAKFCQECGNKVKPPETVFCPNCGNELSDNDDFCSECGTNLNSPAVSFTQKNRKPIIIAGCILAVVIVAVISASLISNLNSQEETLPPQNVEVGSTNFLIPGDFSLDPSTIDIDYKYSSAMFAQGWSNPDGEMIYISTMTVPYNVDASDVLASKGGVEKTLMSHEGYYTEDDGIYNFAFEDGGYICVVSVSSAHLLDEIDCLG